MFQSQIYSRIRTLVSSLSKTNYEVCRSELAEILQVNGETGRMFFVSSLFDEMEFTAPGPGWTRDELKVAVLQDEIIQCLKAPNFVSLLCQSMEGGVRHAIIQQTGRLPEDFLSNACRTLKLSAAHSAALGLVLAHSQYRSLSADGIKFLRSKLPELSTLQAVSDLSEDLLGALVSFVSSHEELRAREVSGMFLQMVRRFPGGGMTAGAPGRQRASIAGILLDIGPACSATAELFSTTLNESCAGLALDEQQTAEIIVSVLIRSPTGELDKWNLEVVADTLAQECRGLNWALVTQRLDLPALSVRSEQDFLLLARLFSRISGVALQAAGLVRLWANRTAQLAILILGTKSSRNIVDFTALVSPDQLLPNDIPVPQNFSWASLPLYSILLELAASGLSYEVLQALTAAVASFPEYILIGFAQVQDSSSSVRAEILRQTLPLFTGLPGSRPSSLSVMKRLQIVNLDLLILLFRIALKRSKTVQDIIEVDMRLRALADEVRRRLEDEGTVDELLGYWCVRADRSDFLLEEWTVAALQRNPQLARSFVAFAKSHAEYLRPRHSDGGLLSFESFAVLLRAVQLHQSIVPIEEMRSLAALVAQFHPGGLPKPSTQMPADRREMNELSAEDLQRPPASDEVEEEANAYFQKIYTSDISIADVIQLLKRFKTSEKVREQEIFRCMIHNLFDEYRFFHKYPEKELLVTGRLFGTLIQHQLVSSITLGIALRYVLEAVRKDPEAGGSSDKMFRFGKIALELFRGRLGEWPQYCSHLVQIPHFAFHCPDIFQEAQRAISTASNAAGSAPQPVPAPAQSEPFGQSVPNMSGKQSDDQLSRQMANMSIGQSHSMKLPTDDSSPDASTSSRINALSAPEAQRVPSAPEAVSVPAPVQSSAAAAVSFPAQADEADHSVDQSPRSPSVIDRMIVINTSTDLPTTKYPPDSIRDQILFIVNNIAKDNCEAKAEELRGLLIADYFCWFANYLVVKRVITMPNLQPFYLSVLETLGFSELFNAVLDATYHNATKLLQSPNITTSSSERSLLRHLGIWLGQITLARNKPLLQRRINLKELLIWGYETARLIAVCSFVAKIIEGVKDSLIFRPPNPWLMAILGVMRELYDIEDLKINIKFEVQVLCKNINIKIDDIPKSNLVGNCRMPVKDHRNPDFTIKKDAPSTGGAAGGASLPPSPLIQSSPQLPPPMAYSIGGPSPGSMPAAINEEGDDRSGSQLEQTVIPNLSAYININPGLEFFAAHPNHRSLVALAVDRAIREIIQPVVERSVSIANITTTKLIMKDFSSEPNEVQLRSGAHLMISNLAGSLALATCKEPLRISITNHLRTLLSQTSVDAAAVEQIVQVCSNDNLELGCILIEKASTEKAIRDVDESIASAVQIRRKYRETNQPFVDVIAAAARNSSCKYPRELPDQLKPAVGGLIAQQLQVYEAFQRPRIVPQVVNQSAEGVASTQMTSDAKGSLAAPQPPAAALSMSQALEAYQVVYARLDASLKNVQAQVQGRDVSIAMLGGSHEILSFLREIIAITQRTVAAARTETATTFCENVFKRLMESLAVSVDSLRLEVMIGVIEALRDACGGAKKIALDIVGWLGRYAAFNQNDEASLNLHRAVLLLLLRAKLMRTQDVDGYFASNMDGGKNIAWVELALIFIHQCLSESLAATYEFTCTFDAVGKIKPANTTIRKQLQKWLTDLRALAASKDDQKTNAPSAARDASVREQVTVLLERWLRVWTSTNDQVFGQYLQLMHQYGVLKTEEAADRFFRIATELCVEACLKSGSAHPSTLQPDVPAANTLTLTVIDALSKLFLLLVRLADKEAGDITVRVNLLSRILNAIARTLVDDHESKKNSNAAFDQRPYFRLLSNLYQDLGIPDAKVEPNQIMVPLLATYYQVYLALQPSQLPGFAFSWLQLISHRSFMPHLLLAKGQKCWPHMHRLMMAMLMFLQPFLKHAQLTEPIRRLYKGTLRVLLVLLHDFPEFLCDFHLSFCDVIPSSCVQLRNLILSAFPRTMRLPDPFTPNLKVDLLPEISQPPRILNDYVAALTERGVRQRLDTYIATKTPADLPSLLSTIVTSAGPGGVSVTNVPLLTSIVVYVGSQAIVQLQSKIPLQNSPSMDIFRQLVVSLEAEGRFHLFNAMANQLRYPNSHTHYFSCVLLVLFADADKEFVQEQITRVLLERLIVHRPHPWGLLITFIELIKNPRYEFWRKGFTHCAPEIERVFESVAKSCMGPAASVTMQQQQQQLSSSAPPAPSPAPSTR